MSTTEATITDILIASGRTVEEANRLLAQFTNELAENLYQQSVPPSSYGSPVRYGYYAAIQRLDRTKEHFYWEHI